MKKWVCGLGQEERGEVLRVRIHAHMSVADFGFTCHVQRALIRRLE